MFRSAKIYLIFIISAITLSGCGLLKPSSRDKAMAKERSEQKAAVRETEALEKGHYKAQTRETQKMMKKSRKDSKKLNRVKKR
jgi:hypothetical protein